MNALSRVVSDLTQKKNSRKLKYDTTTTTTSTWDGDDINPMAFCSPFHDPVFQSNLSKDFSDGSSIKKLPQPQPIIATTTNSSLKKDIPKLEHGKLDLSDMDYDIQFLKRPNPPFKRMSAAIREKFSPDFLRSKSLQKLNNKDDGDQDVEVNNNPFEDCKQTSSLSKIKKQARVIDVHVQQFNSSKRNTDNKNLLKHDQMESD
jgi:hypothetical protein|uniref:Uncharacterized protein n=1 Tax=Panagrolaimus sp. PS1159 TaxID=55785 RepID=A0AC35GB97_9BILA